eukprot:TRINITY_DN18394_c0_g1_i1.p1 TRINITY_DN18394_c0_g1~~TRINITY_DN18394_c0_g1_i1.p1  ORF type:complete len:410 (+),score=63.86 TRINITY_DN18394_c0_g1_i1:114-1343(+)
MKSFGSVEDVDSMFSESEDGDFSNRSNSFLSSTASSIRETGSRQCGEDGEGNKTVNQYSILEQLGEGSYSKVKLVLDNESGAMRAMKVMRKKRLHRKKSLENVKVEMSQLKRLDHENIVALHEIIDDSQDDRLCLIMEYLPKGCVRSFEYTSHEQVASHILDLVTGIAYLHDNLVFHRDIKPDNLLIADNGRLKIADFGSSISFASEAASQSMNSFPGTPSYHPPEVLSGKHAVVAAGPVDIWALGVTIFYMLTGKELFSQPENGLFLKQLRNAVCNADFSFETEVDRDGETLPQSAVQLLNDILKVDPSKRVTALEMARECDYVIAFKLENDYPTSCRSESPEPRNYIDGNEDDDEACSLSSLSDVSGSRCPFSWVQPASPSSLSPVGSRRDSLPPLPPQKRKSVSFE